MKESIDGQHIMKCNGATFNFENEEHNSSAATDANLNGPDTVPENNSDVQVYIPSNSSSDRVSYSSTSLNDSVYNTQQDESSTGKTEFPTVVIDCFREIEVAVESQRDCHWTHENSLEINQLVIIPDDIVHFQLCDDILTTDVLTDTVIEDDSYSEELCSIAVAPDELSGDEFSQSVSGESMCSHHLDQLQEDKDFFSSQQDAMNNNSTENDTVCEVRNQVHITENLTHGNERSAYSVNAKIHCTENGASTESATSIDDRLEICDLNASSNLNSSDSIMSHSIVPNHDNSSEGMQDESNNEENKNDNSQFTQVSVETSVSLLESNTRETTDKSHECKRRPKAREIFSHQGRQSRDKEKQKLVYITELMNLPWGPKFIQRTAKVVRILERKHTRMAAGSLKLMQDGSSNWALFSPTDHRLPRIFIPMRECPSGFSLRPKDFSNFLFLAKIIEWTEGSKFAKGELVQKLGEAGEIDAETHGILLENGVDSSNFSEEALKDLPKELVWTIPQEEVQTRQDFRQECVFTIDPSTARDLDDAVSCNQLEDDNMFEIGVHIADVTYFVKEGTELDNVASDRATSVYLVQSVIPMLPNALCEKLCSLNPGEDRLSFSVVWKITNEGEIIDEWFGRSIIRSCVKLSYEDAQEMIEHPEKEWTSDELPPIHCNYNYKSIVQRVLNLNSVAQKLRHKRFKEGALRLDQVKLQFSLDKESGMPSGFSIYEHRDSNRLIEEFMLLANMAVAHRIYKTFSDQALLRCHPPPERKLMNDVVTTCKAMGIEVDASTSGSLQASLAALMGDDIYSKARSQILTSLCSKPMKCARYFSSGNITEPKDCHHYALNVPLYTHFTSPIRRYPDIVVHRLLAASLDGFPANYASKHLQKLANHCNDKKYTAKRVNELSSELFLTAFIRACGPLDEQAMVMGVMDHSFDVLVLRIGLVKRVYCDKLNLKAKHYQKEKGIPHLILCWNQQGGFVQEIRLFTLVDVTLSVLPAEPLKINVVLKYPDALE